MNFTIRPAEMHDSEKISALVMDLIDYFVPDPDSAEVGPFLESLSVEETRGRIASAEYEHAVAEDGGDILGVIAIRNGTHVYHLFVRSDAHNQGIASALWEHVLKRSGNRVFTVNSSPYAVPVYERFGFRATDRPQAQDGLVFVPMKYEHAPVRVVSEKHATSDISAEFHSTRIRDEQAADIPEISKVIVAAFETLEISDQTEQFIVEALRAAGALAVSLVAEREGRIVGHIAFSPVTLSDGATGWYGLGPVSVHPNDQRKGIGKALINEGLARLKKLGAKGCCLVGHPDYYPQFGFENTDGLVYPGVPPEAFFVLSFDGNVPRGTVTFHEGFGASG